MTIQRGCDDYLWTLRFSVPSDGAERQPGRESQCAQAIQLRDHRRAEFEGAVAERAPVFGAQVQVCAPAFIDRLQLYARVGAVRQQGRELVVLTA
jgi:hypothetical protein